MRDDIARVALSVAHRFAAVPGYDREDLEQEALIAAWQAEESFRPELGSVEARVYVLAHRRLSKLAGRAREKRDALRVASLETCRAPARLDSMTWPLMDAVRAWPLRERRFLIAAACGYSTKEIGESEGLSRQFVNREIQRARTFLRAAA